MRDVVDREDRARLGERRGLGGESTQVLRHERRRPIVAMHDVERLARSRPLPRNFGGRAGQYSEAVRVIGEVLAARAVDAVAVEEPFGVDEHEVDLRREAPVEHRRVDRPIAERQLERREPSRHEEPARLERAVPRQNQGDVVAQKAKRLGERRRHIGEAADLDERRKLGRYERDIHYSTALLARGAHGWDCASTPPA
jgi:hypothetical protein